MNASIFYFIKKVIFFTLKLEYSLFYLSSNPRSVFPWRNTQNIRVRMTTGHRKKRVKTKQCLATGRNGKDFESVQSEYTIILFFPVSKILFLPRFDKEKCYKMLISSLISANSLFLPVRFGEYKEFYLPLGNGGIGDKWWRPMTNWHRYPQSR